MDDMKLMLVDDEPRLLETTRKLLSKKGFTAITASSGEEALEKLKAETVHVVILDVKMPGMDGLTTLKAIKNQFPMIEVIMLTGHATVESAIEGLKSGATDYLMKPADIDEILRKAGDAFANRQHLEEKIRAEKMRKFAGTHRDIIPLFLLIPIPAFRVIASIFAS
jgi:DNA-binding NtrC family response regulator